MSWNRLAGAALLCSSLLAPFAPDPARGAPVDGVAEPGEASALAGCGQDDGLVIGRIRVVAKDIFDPNDPAENRRVYRLADRLHRTTREGVIRSELLFHSGDPYTRQRLEETERALRAQHAFSDASVVPLACHDGMVDVEVTTHDTWTLGGGVNFGRKGGENSVSFEVSDSNFFGTGKEVLLRYDRNVDRSGYQARYLDPTLFGTHNELQLSYFDNDDGERYLVKAGRPFFSLDTRWAAGGELLHDRRIDHLYSRGRVVDGFGHRQDFAEVSGGWSTGLRPHGVRRFRLGFTYDRHDFTAVPDALLTEEQRAEGVLGGDLGTRGALPESRLLAYPWVGFEMVQDDYLEAVDMDQIGRTEDRYLGTRLSAHVGYSSALFGGDRGRAIASAEWSTAWRPSDRLLLEVGAQGAGRYGDAAEDVLVGGQATLHWRDFGDQLLFVHASGDWADDLDGDHQLLLGGDSGLRGYPLRFQDGDRRFLFTVEQRVFTDWYPFHLVRVGGAAFFDVGRAWFADGRVDNPDGLDGVLADVGVGLRIGLDRSGRGSILHLDVAMPLQRDDSFGGLQWLVSTRRSF